VESVVSGYADGTVPNPSYEQVCGGRTSHAEVVQIAYDPNVISYRDLLDVFFTVHDPTTKDRQGADDVLLEVGLQVEKPVGYAEDFPNATVWSGSNALSPG
jgi:methionine-S-sulfoxide reductase